MLINLENQIALVTGASRGIGQSIALSLGKQKAIVIGTATTEEGAQKISAFLKEQNIAGKGIMLDVNDNEAILKTVDNIIKDHGDISILVNNAGITKDGLLMRMSEEDWDAVLTVNLKGTFACTKAVSRIMMKQRSGSIINIASVVGLMGNAGQANYAASKGGVIAFTKSVAKELASRNIRANAVAPGFISSKMTDALSADVRQKMLEAIPLASFGTPEDVANAVAFLACDQSSYITGQVISVNGGMVM